MRNLTITAALMGVVASLMFSVAAQETDPVAVLTSDADYLAKTEACRVLAIKGGPEAVAALEPLLLDEKLSHMARLALEPMPCAEAGAALRNALGKTTGNLQAGMIHSLAMRGDTQAVPQLVKLLSSDNETVAQAAAEALGKLATQEAVLGLGVPLNRADLPPAVLRACCGGLLACAEKLAVAGQADQAGSIYDRLLALAPAPASVHAAALRGAILARNDTKKLAEAIQGEDVDLYNAAQRAARELAGDEATAALAGLLPQLPEARKLNVIEILGERGGAAAGTALMAEAGAGAVPVRAAALRALTRIGHAPVLELLAQLVTSEDADLAKAAQDALCFFPGEGGDNIIKSMLASDKVESRSLAVKLIAAGGLNKPTGLLMASAASDADAGVRVAALRALRSLAGMDQLPGLLEYLLANRSADETEAAESVLKALVARQPKVPAGEVVVREALYGDVPNGPSANVTDKVAQLVVAGTLTIPADNATFGDTAPGVPKRLRVTFTANGVESSQTVEEGGTMVLATADVSPALMEALAAAYDKATGDAKPAMIRVLAATAGKQALDIVLAAAGGEDGPVKEAAVRELCGWPSFDAFPRVMELATTASDTNVKHLARRGAVRLIKLGAISVDEKLQHYAVLMEQSQNADDRKLVLSGLAEVPDMRAFETVLREFANADVRTEAVQAAIAIAKKLGGAAREDTEFAASAGLPGWKGDIAYWRFEDGEIIGHSEQPVEKNEFLWAKPEVRDFYLVVDVKLEPNTANSGIQFRSKRINDHGQALGYQADMGQDVWGRLYHEQGRGKLDWHDRAEAAVKPGDWNRYEILAVGPAIWTAINGTLGVACLDLDAADERAGLLAFQVHAGAPQTAHFRIVKLVYDPPVQMEKVGVGELFEALRAPGQD